MIFIQRSAGRSASIVQQTNNFNQRRKGDLGGQNCSNRENEYIHRPNVVKTCFTCRRYTVKSHAGENFNSMLATVCCVLAASAVKAPRLAIPLASSNELTNDPSWGLRAASAALASYCPGTAARVTVIPVTQVGIQGSQTGYTPRKQQRTQQDECPSRFKL